MQALKTAGPGLPDGTCSCPRCHRFAALVLGMLAIRARCSIVLEHPGRQNRMGARAGVDRTTMTYLVDRLEERGLVERHPDPTDRRAHRLTATSAGRALILEDLATVPAQLRERLLQGLSPEQQAQFLALLTLVATPRPGEVLPWLPDREDDPRPRVQRHGPQHKGGTGLPD